MCCKNCCDTEKEKNKPLEVGDSIGYRARLGNVIVGSAEPKFVKYISESMVVWSISTDGGRDLGEQAMSRSKFDDTFERYDYS